MQKLTAEDALHKIEGAQPETDLRVTRRLEIGSVIHQGDVYLHRVPNEHPRGAELGTRQVAVGTSVGSRHVVQGSRLAVFEGMKYPSGFSEPAWVRQNALLGPVVVAEEEFALTHPEHAHHQLPAGVYQVTYQADMVSMRAVAD